MKISRFVWLICSIVFTSFTWGQQAANETVALTDGVMTPDVRIVIDISGSMKKNDPNYLRRPALELLVQLFPEGSKAGVWTFGQWVNNLVPRDTVDANWRANASAQAENISSVALRTNIPAALEKAMADVAKMDANYSTHLILLTDGMVDVSPSSIDNDRARQRIIADILPVLKDAGVTIHTVALSQNADSELMELLAAETGGLAAVAETADDLSRIFVQAFDAAAPAEQLPMEGNTFNVDAGIEEFTTLIFKKDGSKGAVLLSPAGETYSFEQRPEAIKWFRQHNYELITVKSPQTGEWAVDSDLEPGSRVTVISDLSLKVVPLKRSHFIDDSATVTAALYEEGRAITKPELLNLIDISATVTRRDDQQQWLVSLSEIDPIPDNGVYTTALDVFAQVGIYDVVVVANGKTFQRQQTQTIAVRQRYDIRATRTGSEPPQHTIKLYARDGDINGAEVDVTAHIITPANVAKTISVEMVSERRWRLELPSMEQAGIVKVAFQLEGVLRDGSRLSERTQTIDVEHHIPGQQWLPEAEAETLVGDLADVAEKKMDVESAPITAQITASKPAEEIAVVTTVEQSASDNIDWKSVALYAGIAIAQILAMVLIYFVYKAIAGSRSKSSVLNADDEPGELVAVAKDTADVELHSDIPAPSVAMPDENELDALLEAADEEKGRDSLDQLAEASPAGEALAEDDEYDLDGEQFDSGELEVDLDDTDFVDMQPEESPANSLELELEDVFDLPDDAIDIDPDTENNK
ncbi:MAG: vWA domain-containing protein [Oceanicoccus sp.]